MATLYRSGLLQRFRANFMPEDEVSLIVVTGRDVVVKPIGPDSSPGIAQELQALLLHADDPELDLQGEQLLLRWTPSAWIGLKSAWHAVRGCAGPGLHPCIAQP